MLKVSKIKIRADVILYIGNYIMSPKSLTTPGKADKWAILQKSFRMPEYFLILQNIKFVIRTYCME